MANQMAGAHIPDHDIEAKLNEHIHVRKVDRSLAGSCNACTPQTQAQEYDQVTEVHLRGLSVRLCTSCKAKLKKLL